MDKKHRYRLFAIIFGASFLIVLTVYLVIVFLSDIDSLNKVLQIGIIVLLSAFISLFFLFLMKFINHNVVLKTLEAKDLYVFGQRMDIYNRNLFETKVTSMRGKRKYRNQYQAIVRFTTAPESMVNFNSKRDESITFNLYVAQYLKDLFNKEPQKYVYAYDNSGYYVYIFGGNRFDVLNLLTEITNKMYEIIEKNNLHLYTSPFYGIDEPKKNQHIVECIENAIIARNASEKNYESVTFYQTSLRTVSKKDDSDMILKGLENNEFVVYYQPKFNLKQQKFISAEALIRWNSPEFGLLTPGQFLPKAEASGLTNELDKFVLTQVCKDIQDCIKRGRRVVPISLNFSLFEFFHMNFLDTITKTMEEYNVPPHLIEIEILERTSQSNPFLSISIIKKLKEKGIRVLMDDFGIGYSNISNLSKIPFDTIKIDQSYVKEIETDEKAKNIVKCLVDLGKLNGLEVIAEGVDTKGQVEILKEFGCDTIQGFYYSKPIKRTDFSKLLVSNEFEVKDKEDK